MIQIQPIGVDDIETLLRLAMAEASPREVMPPVSDGSAWTEDCQVAFRSFYESRRNGLAKAHREEMFLIFDEGYLIGSAGLAHVADDVFETGMWLGRSSRGKGRGTKALRALLDDASARGAVKLVATTTATNAGALGILRKCGAIVTGPDNTGAISAEFSLL